MSSIMVDTKHQILNYNEIESIKAIILSSDILLITAGAGMSADSGLPTFRGDMGFWKEFPVFESSSTRFPDIATPDLFHNDPYLAWAFYGYRYEMYKEKNPHDGYYKLLELCKQKNDDYFVFTSNVDGHFLRAGFPEENIVECHGSINHFQCLNDSCGHVWESKEADFVVDIETMYLMSEVPTCSACGNPARPNILMFDDFSWNCDRNKNQQNSFSKWRERLNNKQSKVVVLELGAGQVVRTIQNISEIFVKEFDARLVRVNNDPKDVVCSDLSLCMTSEEAIDCISVAG